MPGTWMMALPAPVRLNWVAKTENEEVNLDSPPEHTDAEQLIGVMTRAGAPALRLRVSSAQACAIGDRVIERRRTPSLSQRRAVGGDACAESDGGASVCLYLDEDRRRRPVGLHHQAPRRERQPSGQCGRRGRRKEKGPTAPCPVS